jgi:hypothetical protein
MRFPDKEISYKIYDCPLQKKNDMEQAFDIISNKTILVFYPVSENEKVSVTCDSKNRIEEQGLFIAGEGGPTNITITNLFGVILHGKILLIKESSCPQSNIAVHELLHVLGFKHSENENNIMYPISECNQIISDDIINLIDGLYSIKSAPDLTFENVSANINGRYLNTEINIVNQGLEQSENSKISIYANNKFVKDFNLDPIGVGDGIKITQRGIWISNLNTKELKFFINSSFDEINKENNNIVLQIQK